MINTRDAYRSTIRSRSRASTILVQNIEMTPFFRSIISILSTPISAFMGQKIHGCLKFHRQCCQNSRYFMYESKLSNFLLSLKSAYYISGTCAELSPGNWCIMHTPLRVNACVGSIAPHDMPSLDRDLDRWNIGIEMLDRYRYQYRKI